MLRVTIKTDKIPKKIIHFRILLSCENRLLKWHPKLLPSKEAMVQPIKPKRKLWHNTTHLPSNVH